jgi:thioredoxin-like negative regulator of GroEL
MEMSYRVNDILEATRENIDAIRATQGWVLLDVWGPQCAPCLALMPYIEELRGKYPELTVAKLEAPKARRVCIDLRVMQLPTLLLYQDGEEVSRISDANLSSGQVDEWLEKYMS